MRLCYRVLLFFFVLAFYGYSPAFGEQGDMEQKLSLNFTGAPVSQVLDELTRLTGIEIIANEIPDDKKITKFFKNLTIEQIVKDLFRGTSFALIWDGSPSVGRSLEIRVFAEGGNNTTSYSPPERERRPRPVTPFRRPPPQKRNSDEDDESEDIESAVEREEPEEEEKPVLEEAEEEETVTPREAVEEAEPKETQEEGDSPDVSDADQE